MCPFTNRVWCVQYFCFCALSSLWDWMQIIAISTLWCILCWINTSGIQCHINVSLVFYVNSVKTQKDKTTTKKKKPARRWQKRQSCWRTSQLFSAAGLSYWEQGSLAYFLVLWHSIAPYLSVHVPPPVFTPFVPHQPLPVCVAPLHQVLTPVRICPPWLLCTRFRYTRQLFPVPRWILAFHTHRL